MANDARFFIETQGVYYLDRNGAYYRLDFTNPPFVPRPERDVLIALLRFILEGLTLQSAFESVSIPDDTSSPHHS